MSDADDAAAWEIDEDPDAWQPVTAPNNGTEEDPAEMDPLERLAGRVQNVETLLADVVDLLSSRGGKSRWSWMDIGDQERESLWLELAGFVAFLEARYLVHLDTKLWQIPPCWYLHPVAVEELTALMVAYKSAYGPQASKPSPNLVEYHERSLWPTLTRLRDLKVYDSCKNGSGHQDDTAYRRRPWVPDDAFESFLGVEKGADDD